MTKKRTRVSQPNRITLALSGEQPHILREIERHTGYSPAQTVSRLLLAHTSELWAYLAHLEALPEGPSPERSKAIDLLRCYGPLNLVEGIQESRANPWTR